LYRIGATANEITRSPVAIITGLVEAIIINIAAAQINRIFLTSSDLQNHSSILTLWNFWLCILFFFVLVYI